MSWRALKLDADAVVSDGNECGVLVVGVSHLDFHECIRWYDHVIRRDPTGVTTSSPLPLPLPLPLPSLCLQSYFLTSFLSFFLLRGRTVKRG